jgi:protease-4
MLGALLGRSVAGVLENVGQTLTGTRVLWLGESRF